MKDNDNSRLEKQLELQNKKLQHIFNISRKSVSILISKKPQELNALLQAIIDETTEVLESEIGSILLINPAEDNMTIYVAKGLSKAIISKTKLKVGERISGWVAQHKKGVLVSDIEKDSRFAKRSQEKYYTKSLIAAPIMMDNTALGVININNKRSRQSYGKEDLDLLETMAAHAALLISNANQYKALQSLYLNTVEALAEAIDAKDHYTKKHSEHVNKYAAAIAKELKLPKEKIEIIEKAARLHDIGKIGIHDYILTKPGKLTEKEWKEIRGHSLKGVKILKPLTFLDGVINVIRQHHERYDGAGYPDKKKKNEICVEARIMSVADAFDAMTTERPYAKAMTKQEAIKELKRESGKQFDPDIVSAFLKILEAQKHPVSEKELCCKK